MVQWHVAFVKSMLQKNYIFTIFVAIFHHFYNCFLCGFSMIIFVIF